MTPQDGLHDHDSVRQILHQLQPQLQRLFRRFRLPIEVAERMLEDCLLVMTFRYEQLAQPDQWLLHTLRYRCTRYWRSQREHLLDEAHEQLVGWLRDPQIEEAERRSRSQELIAVIDTMPRRCRLQLRDYYNLPIPEQEVRAAREYLNHLYLVDGQNPNRCLAALIRRLTTSPAADSTPALETTLPS